MTTSRQRQSGCVGVRGVGHHPFLCLAGCLLLLQLQLLIETHAGKGRSFAYSIASAHSRQARKCGLCADLIEQPRHGTAQCYQLCAILQPVQGFKQQSREQPRLPGNALIDDGHVRHQLAALWRASPRPQLRGVARTRRREGGRWERNQAHTHARTQAGRAGRQARNTDRQAGRQPSKRVSKHASRQASKHASAAPEPSGLNPNADTFVLTEQTMRPWETGNAGGREGRLGEPPRKSIAVNRARSGGAGARVGKAGGEASSRERREEGKEGA